MPNLDTIVYSQPWAEGGSQQAPPVRAPFTVAAIGGVDGANFIQRPSIKDIDFSGKIAKARQCNQSGLRVEGDEVPGKGAKVCSDFDPLVE